MTVTDKRFKTFWHYFQNILVMLVETISSRKKELVLSDREMDIFNCSFTQKDNVLINSESDKTTMEFDSHHTWELVGCVEA